MKKLLLIALLLFPSVAHADIISGLVGWWRLDTGTGTTDPDSSGSGLTGTLNNTPTWNTTGKIAGDLSFASASSEYVDIGNNLNLTSAITIAFWIKFATIPSNGTGTDAMAPVNKNEGGGYGIIANNSGDGRLETFFFINSAYANAGETLANYSAGTWYHIVATFDGTDTKFYRNGTLIQTVTRAGTISTVTFKLTLGANPGATYNQFFNGELDDVRIYNRALSSTDVTELYGTTGFFGSMIAAGSTGGTSRLACSGPFTAPENGSISSLVWYATAASGNWRGAIYDSDGTSGAPGTLLAQATSDTALPTSAGRSSSTLSTPLSMVSGHTYHLCGFSDTSVTYYYSAISPYNVWLASTQSTSYPTFPSSFAINTTSINREMDIYAIYTPSSGGVIKTLDGIVLSSIKTIDGIAIGSIKTINGLATQ